MLQMVVLLSNTGGILKPIWHEPSSNASPQWHSLCQSRSFSFLEQGLSSCNTWHCCMDELPAHSAGSAFETLQVSVNLCL